MDEMAQLKVDELLVVIGDDPDNIITLLPKRDIISYYYELMGGGK